MKKRRLTKNVKIAQFGFSIPGPESRKNFPLYTGFVKYFPDAINAAAHVSFVGNQQHNPGEPLHWAKDKSVDHEDALMRHMKDRAAGRVFDDDGERISAKILWRAAALCQIEIEKDRQDSAKLGAQQ